VEDNTELTTQTIPLQEPTTKPEPNRIDVAKAFDLRYNHGLTYSQIGEKYGVTKSAVHQALTKFEQVLKNAHQLPAYTEHRRTILNVAEMELVSDLLDPERREKASLNNTAFAFGKIHEARRLEEDLSTSNNDLRVLTIKEEDIKRRLKAIDEELANLE